MPPGTSCIGRQGRSPSDGRGRGATNQRLSCSVLYTRAVRKEKSIQVWLCTYLYNSIDAFSDTSISLSLKLNLAGGTH